jgi:rubrerythrin
VRPGSETLRALLGTVNTKLDLCARLPFLAYQAEREGFGDAAATFRELAQDEHRSLTGLLTTLKSHLDVTQDLASKERTP